MVWNLWMASFRQGCMRAGKSTSPKRANAAVARFNVARRALAVLRGEVLGHGEVHIYYIVCI